MIWRYNTVAAPPTFAWCTASGNPFPIWQLRWKNKPIKLQIVCSLQISGYLVLPQVESSVTEVFIEVVKLEDRAALIVGGGVGVVRGGHAPQDPSLIAFIRLDTRYRVDRERLAESGFTSIRLNITNLPLWPFACSASHTVGRSDIPSGASQSQLARSRQRIIHNCNGFMWKYFQMR